VFWVRNMGKETIVDSLQALVDNNTGRSQIDRLTDIFSEVESALLAGVPRKIVLDTLHKDYGFTMSMSGFEKALAKIRKKHLAPSGKTPTGQPPCLTEQVVAYTPETATGREGVVTANANNLPALTGELVVYTDKPATGEVLEGASVKQEEWEDDELGDANRPREESDMEKSTREAIEFVQDSLSKGSIESALSRTPEKPQIRIPGNT